MKTKQFQISAAVISVALALATLAILAHRPAKLHATPVPPTVTFSGQRIEQSSVATADLDGDGDKEIVVGGGDGRLYVIAYNGSSWSVVWSRQTADDLNAAGAPTACANTSISDIRSAPAIADLDGDGHLEIVVTTGGDPGRSTDGLPHRNGGVLVYRYNSPWSFSVAPGWPQPKQDIVGLGSGASWSDGCWDGIWGSPALGDLDGDGDLEIAVEGIDRRLHVWHHNGVYAAGWPIAQPTISRGGWSTPAIADIDQDGLPELVFGTDYPAGGPYRLYVFNGDATILPGFPVTAAQNMQSAPAIGDVDDDGWLDIVVGTGTYEVSGGNKVYAWDHTGNLLPGWPTTTGGKMPASPALGDLDGDGDLEVVIGCGAEGDPYNPPPCTLLYAWHGDGSNVSGFPMVPANNSWVGDSNKGLPNAPVLADYDGDGSIEILVVNRWSWGISTVGNNGTSQNDADLMTQNSLNAPPVVDDVDNDGRLEIVIGGANSSGANGAIYIWNKAGSTSSQSPWPMFHHDVQRTGRFAAPPKLGFPGEIRFLHQQGTSNSETLYVSVQNEGGGQFDWNITHSITRLQVVPSSGTVISVTPVQFTLNTAGLATGWTSLGSVTINGTADGSPVDGSPRTAAVSVYVGDLSHVYLPMILRNQ